MPKHKKTLKALAALADQPRLKDREAHARTIKRLAWADQVLDVLEEVQASEAPLTPTETNAILNILTTACAEDRWPRELHWVL
jgi:hypothetical protein